MITSIMSSRIPGARIWEITSPNEVEVPPEIATTDIKILPQSPTMVVTANRVMNVWALSLIRK